MQFTILQAKTKVVFVFWQEAVYGRTAHRSEENWMSWWNTPENPMIANFLPALDEAIAHHHAQNVLSGSCFHLGFRIWESNGGLFWDQPAANCDEAFVWMLRLFPLSWASGEAGKLKVVKFDSTVGELNSQIVPGDTRSFLYGNQKELMLGKRRGEKKQKEIFKYSGLVLFVLRQSMFLTVHSDWRTEWNRIWLMDDLFVNRAYRWKWMNSGKVTRIWSHWCEQFGAKISTVWHYGSHSRPFGRLTFSQWEELDEKFTVWMDW